MMTRRKVWAGLAFAASALAASAMPHEHEAGPLVLKVAGEDDVAQVRLNTRASLRPRDWASRTRAAIARQQSYPDSLRQAARAAGTPLPTGRVMLAFALDRRGRLVSLAIKEGSGVPELDAAALNMVRRAAPLPAPPLNVGGKTVRLELPVSFHGHD